MLSGLITRLICKEKRGPSWAVFDAVAYAAMHIACLGAFLLSPSSLDLLLGASVFLVTSFGISVGWHRYLSHRAFATGRVAQFAIVLCGVFGGMKGPLWFAQFHLDHHRLADREEDVHSPWSRGWAYSHSGWFLDRRHRDTDYARVRRWARFPELVWLNEWCLVVALATGLLILLSLGPGALVWGYLIPTLAVWHGFKSIGSFCHGIGGYRRFATPDLSCNQPWVSLLTFGEGWHNNHHYAPYSARLGVAWWELDPGWWLIWLLERAGLVWDVRRPPAPGRSRHAERFARHLRDLERELVEEIDAESADAARRSLRRFAGRADTLFRVRPARLPALVIGMLADIGRIDRSAARRAERRLLAGRFRHLWRRPSPPREVTITAGESDLARQQEPADG